MGVQFIKPRLHAVCYMQLFIEYLINSPILLARAQEDEIPIWICGEPRFISGISCSTTCDQLIQALIDDEICNDAGEVRNDDLNKRGKYFYF